MMSDNTITREEALKERVEIISSSVCLHVVDNNRSSNNGHLKTFMKSEAIKAESFAEGYRRALMNDNGKDSASGVRVNALVSWLKQRKNEVDKKWAEAQENGDGSTSATYQDLYQCYAGVIGDIIIQNKEAN